MIKPPLYGYNNSVSLEDIRNIVLKSGLNKGLAKKKLKLEQVPVLALSPLALNSLIKLANGTPIRALQLVVVLAENLPQS